MGKIMTLIGGYSSISLTDGNTYNAGDEVVLTDAEYAALTTAQRKTLSFIKNTPDPQRPTGLALSGGVTITSGSGAPTASAVKGSIYIRTDTPTTSGQKLYINTTGSTTWVGLAI